MELTDIALQVGRLHEKTDQQTALLRDIKESTDGLAVRVASLESSRNGWRTAWRYTKLVALGIFGWITGKHYG
jgi:hypothetical protein